MFFSHFFHFFQFLSEHTWQGQILSSRREEGEAAASNSCKPSWSEKLESCRELFWSDFPSLARHQAGCNFTSTSKISHSHNFCSVGHTLEAGHGRSCGRKFSPESWADAALPLDSGPEFIKRMVFPHFSPLFYTMLWGCCWIVCLNGFTDTLHFHLRRRRRRPARRDAGRYFWTYCDGWMKIFRRRFSHTHDFSRFARFFSTFQLKFFVFKRERVNFEGGFCFRVP